MGTIITHDPSKFDIIRDTKERNGWDFAKSQYINLILSQHLDTGDYTMPGYEKILCIERKQSISEFAGNISQQRFSNELERMTKFQYRYLIFEFDFQAIMDWPYKAGLPKWKIPYIRVTPKFIMHFLSEIQIKYEIPTLFCSNRDNAQYAALNIMRRIREKHNVNKEA